MELLAPAGSPEALDAAVGEGADAVYLGLKDFNARLRSANFTYAQFESALRSLRRMGKKVYVTVNTVFEQRESDRMYQFLKYLASQGPDALIVQDFGVIEMARSQFPSLKLHASTQMNISSARGANALSRHGVSRVVLSRELTLEELRSIKKETNLELEVFVHGALCISVSGLCLFSSFLGGKSANRGMCTQACRRLYRCEGGLGGRSAADESFENPFDGGADENSGYFFSPNDLQLLERVPDLAAAGIASLKIEGRMKSASYVGAVVSAYRLVVDAVAHNGGDEEQIRLSIEKAKEILRNDFARPKTRYFFDLKKDEAETGAAATVADWLNPEQDGGTGISLGAILKVKSFSGAEGNVRCVLVSPPQGLTLSARDSVRVHKGDDSGRVSQKLTFVKNEGRRGVWISAPEGEIGDRVYLIQTKAMSKRYAPVITGAASSRGTGRERAPLSQIEITARKEESSGTRRGKRFEAFPEGLYVAVSRPEDLYILQSSRPVRALLPMSEKNIKYLLAENKAPGHASQVLPFKPAEIILTLEPWFPQIIGEYEKSKLEENLERLIEKGYLNYQVNNLGHFSLFRNFKNVKLIAGPWLYMFNSWSLSFVSSLGADGFVSPLENNRQNLERTLSELTAKDSRLRRPNIQNTLRSKFFVTVFALPPLFNIRANLGKVLDFKTFFDNRGEAFSLVTGYEGSRVYPKSVFSITDKIPFLKEAGFARFIIDLQGEPLKKNNYRDLMRAVETSSPLPNANRFNWKNGFYNKVVQ